MYFSERKLKLGLIFMLILILTMAFYNLFYGLSSFPIYSWDEARHGVSAYEMLKRNNFFVNTYRNKIDYWNLKPPLSFWTTIMGYKIAGFNTVGLRIFSVIFSSMTIIMVTIFVNKRHGLLAALISTLTLATSTQFLINHSARTGDADSLFVFLFTAAMLALLVSKNSNYWISVSGIAFSLAFLTKSWHAGNILIIIFLYLLLTGRYKQFSFKNWIFLFSCISLPILLWGIARYHYDGSTFFRNMVAYDLLKRSSTTIEGHIGSKFYYFGVLWRFAKLWVILLLSLFILYIHKNSPLASLKQKNLSYILGICLWVFIPLILYSIVETKVRWYILPVYPGLSIMMGVLSCYVLREYQLFLKTALLGFILYCSYSYETEIFTYIHHPNARLQVMLLQKLQNIDGIKGFSIFNYNTAKAAKWEQNAVLAAELYGDLIVKNGGLNDFIKSNRGVLLLNKDRLSKHLIDNRQLYILASNKWGYIVCTKETARRLQ